MGGASFMQLPESDRVKKIADSFPFQDDMDRKSVMSFLDQSGDYVPQSGQIVGILKQMKEEMEGSLAKAVKEEEAEAATTAIETKQTRAGELAVTVVQVADDIEDTTDEVADTEKFAKQLDEQCGTKEKEWAEREKLRSEEISAISDAIGILNDDDALDVFKKAIPSALVEEKLGFLQSRLSAASRVHKAQAILSMIPQSNFNKGTLKLMLFMLNSKLKLHAKRRARGQNSLQGFEDVTKMVDDMVKLEGDEQEADNKKQPWCNGEFEKSDREEKSEKVEIEKLEAEVSQDADLIDGINAEIATLKEEIMELDKAVAEATEQRKDEHEDYVENIQLTGTAIELVGKAKNWLQKFYNPTLYKAPPKHERTMEEKILEAGGAFAQYGSDDQVAPPPPPETFGAYEKSSGKSSGVLALMDSIVKELEDDIKDAEYEEKTAQKDYEELMTDSGEARAQKVKGITDKEQAKATVSSKKLQASEKEKADFRDVNSINKYQNTLHGDCDFILENYDARKEARTQEIESLKNAKAVLSGAKI